MRRAGLVLAMLAGLAVPAIAADAPDRPAIESVIDRQIAAFRHDDAGAAYGFAAPNIQHLFGDADHFLAMVRNGYPPVYRPRSYVFGTLTIEQGEIVQRVELIGPDGHNATALYTMEREPDGTWRISGCTLINGASLST